MRRVEGRHVHHLSLPRRQALWIHTGFCRTLHQLSPLCPLRLIAGQDHRVARIRPPLFQIADHRAVVAHAGTGYDHIPIEARRLLGLNHGHESLITNLVGSVLNQAL
ncbi:hypothetical protein D3C78_1587010 [compost metagenome]